MTAELEWRQVEHALGEAVEYRFHHVGIAAANDASAKRIMAALGVSPAWSNLLERHCCRCHYCPGEPIDVEIVVPLTADSSVSKIPLGLHHLAVAVEDIEEAQRRLSERGYRTLEREPLPIVGRYLVNFLEPLRTGFLVELVQDLGGPLAEPEGALR